MTKEVICGAPPPPISSCLLLEQNYKLYPVPAGAKTLTGRSNYHLAKNTLNITDHSSWSWDHSTISRVKCSIPELPLSKFFTMPLKKNQWDQVFNLEKRLQNCTALTYFV